jgi:serine/threonine protein kinase
MVAGEGGESSSDFVGGLFASISMPKLTFHSYFESRQVRLTDLRPIGRLGQYHVLSRSRGGMGEVYVCLRDIEGLQPPVALKTFQPHLEFDPPTRRGFRRECALWARASLAPNILPLWGMENIDGRTFIAMPGVLPGVDGEVTLGDLMDVRPPSVALTLCLARMIAGSLAIAAKAVPGLVHGDLKPSNILMMWPNVPYISDFGLARLAQTGLQGDVLRPDRTYCSPNARDPAAALTVLDDVYSYGLIISELLDRITDPRGPQNDGAASRKVAEQVRSELLVLAQQCCAPDPDLRPGSFGAIYTRIERIVPSEEWHFPPELSRFPNPEIRPERLVMVAGTLLELEEYGMTLEFISGIHPQWTDWRIVLYRGVAHLRLGHHRQGRKMLRKAWTARRQQPEDSSSARELALISYLLACAHIMVHSYRVATSILHSLIDQAPDAGIRANALFSLVSLYIEKRCYKQAEWLIREHRCDYDPVDYWHQLGIIYLRLCNWVQAVEAFRQAAQLDPLNPVRHSHLGQAFAGLADCTAEALASFNRALDCGDLASETMVFSLACARRLGDAGQIDRLTAIVSRHFEQKQIADIQHRAAILAQHMQTGTVPALRRARSDVRWEKRGLAGLRDVGTSPVAEK